MTQAHFETLTLQQQQQVNVIRNEYQMGPILA